MILNTCFPESFAGSVGWHVETNNIICPFILKGKKYTVFVCKVTREHSVAMLC